MLLCFPHLPPTPPQSHRHAVPMRIVRRISPRATGAAGAAAPFPEQVAGGSPPQLKRRRSVAGVDQEKLVDPTDLADPDSTFFELNGVKIHHKIVDHRREENQEAAGIGLPMILLHGFGASVFSWHRVMKPLARFTGSKVLAFDRPAFGLTSRVLREAELALNPYSMAFSVLATISFIETLGAQKAILMGHSAGCLVAVNTYFEAPENVAALILVAPAIFAPFGLRQGRKGNGNEEEQDGGTEDVFIRMFKGLKKFFMFIAGLIRWMLKGVRDVIAWMCVRALTVVLRSSLALMVVRMIMDKFGILAIRNAWYDASQVTDHVLQGYTKPLRAKGWEKALLEYTIAMITHSASKSVTSARSLAEITCPVLIITGDTDRLVPAWNAERLSRIIPGARFEVIKNCGHLPHEEKTEEFMTVVERFLQRVFGAGEAQFSHATA